MESRRCISRTLAATALAGVLGAAPAWAEPRSYTIDPDHFAIGFQETTTSATRTLSHVQGERTLRVR